MDNLKLIAYTDAGELDLSPVSASYSMSDDVDSLGACFSFELACNPLDKYLNKYVVPVGSKVVFSDAGVVLFSGIVVDISQSGLYRRSLTCYDYGFYLTRNKVLIQFNGASTSTAITQLCKRAGVPVGKICGMSTSVWGIYDGKTVADVIKDLIAKYTAATGKKIRLEVIGGKLYAQPYSDLELKLSYKPADNVAAFDPALVPGSVSVTESIGDMRNRVQLTSGDELHKYTVATASDAKSIKRFGLLTEVAKVDDKDYFRASTVAKNRLKELNRIKKSINVELLGDNSVRAGRIITLDLPALGVSGRMLVKHCEHKYTGTTHTMSLELDSAEGV